MLYDERITSSAISLVDSCGFRANQLQSPIGRHVHDGDVYNTMFE